MWSGNRQASFSSRVLNEYITLREILVTEAEPEQILDLGDGVSVVPRELTATDDPETHEGILVSVTGTIAGGADSLSDGYALDLARDPVPVGPAAHYVMGGVKTNTDGLTSLPGLFAAGEASGGIHGGDRDGAEGRVTPFAEGDRAGAIGFAAHGHEPFRSAHDGFCGGRRDDRSGAIARADRRSCAR